MRQAEYPYPPDEFDAAANAGGPRGVHRTPRSAWSRWWPWLVALVVFPALAFGAVTVLSDWDGFGSTGSQASTSSSASSSTSQTTEPTESETETETAEPTETATPTPEPDLDRTVRVENATLTSGLAGGARADLEAAGFTDVSTGNWNGETLDVTTVLYPADEDLGTATRVAELLGIDEVTLDPDLAGDQVLVVLEADYIP